MKTDHIAEAICAQCSSNELHRAGRAACALYNGLCNLNNDDRQQLWAAYNGQCSELTLVSHLHAHVRTYPEACSITGRTALYEPIHLDSKTQLTLAEDLRLWVGPLPPVAVKQPDIKQERGAISGARSQKAAPAVKTVTTAQAKTEHPRTRERKHAQ
jgi:hypothetical protein